MEGWAAYKELAPPAPELRPGAKFHVFLSHRSIDKPWVASLYRVLKDAGYQPFIDAVHIRPGKPLRLTLEEALEASQAGVLVWSDQTEGSDWVRNEYDSLLNLVEGSDDFIFVPLRLDDTPLPLFAQNRLYLDFFGDWNDPGKQVLRLMYALRDEDFPEDLALPGVEELAEYVAANDVKMEETEHGAAAVSTKGAKVERRKPDLIGPNPDDFVGRDVPRAQAMRAFGRAEIPDLVVLVGPRGMGKKALVRDMVKELRRELPASFAPDTYKHGIGAIPKVAATAQVDDVLHAIWAQFWEKPDGTRVKPRKQNRQLAKVKAHIVLPDLALEPAGLRQISDSLPQATVVVTATEAAHAPAKHVSMPTMPAEEVRDLFASELDVDGLPDSAEQAIDRIGKMLLGRPGLIKVLAGHAYREVPDLTGADDDDHPFTRWARSQASLGAADLVASMVSVEARAAVDVVQAVGVKTPREVVADVAGSEAAIDEALIAEVLEQGSPRYQVTGALADRLPPTDTDATMAAVLESAVKWANAATREELFEDREFVMRMLRWAVEHQQWWQVLALAGDVEPALAHSGRWDAWREVLDATLLAARSIEPPQPKREAWALHQLGSRALVVDDMETARTHLHAALERREDEDPEAAAVTRQNLKLVPMALSAVFAVTVAVLALAAMVTIFVLPDPKHEEVLIDIEPEAIVAGGPESDNGPPAQTVTVTHEGGRSLELSLDRLRADLPPGVTLQGDAPACALSIENPECVLVLTVPEGLIGGTPPRFDAVLQFDRDVRGDTRIILLGVEPAAG